MKKDDFYRLEHQP